MIFSMHDVFYVGYHITSYTIQCIIYYTHSYSGSDAAIGDFCTGFMLYPLYIHIIHEQMYIRSYLG